jgi:hypothetical protein
MRAEEHPKEEEVEDGLEVVVEVAQVAVVVDQVT